MAINPQNVQAFKFNFDFVLQKINLAISFPCKIQVVIKRGTQKIESNHFDLESGVAKMDQSLNLETNLYHDIDHKTFLEKKATFTVLIITSKGQKVAGTCQIDLAHYARNRIPNKQELLKLEKCPDKNALFQFHISVSMLGQVQFDGVSMSSVASKAQEYITADDVKAKQATTHSSRNPSQTQLPNDSEIKSPVKSIEGNDSKLNNGLSHQRSNSKQINGISSQNGSQSSSVVQNGDKKVDSQLQKQLEQMKVQLDDNQVEKFAFQKKIEQLKKNLTDQEEKINELLKEKQESIKQINSLNQMVRNQSNGDDNLKKQCETYEKQLSEKVKVIEKKEQSIQEQSQQIKKLQEQMAQNQTQLNQNLDHMKTIQQLQLQISQLKNNDSSGKDDIKLKQKIDEQQSTIDKLQNELESVKQQTNDIVRVRVNEVYTKQQSIIQQLENSNSQSEKLLNDKKTLMEELTEKKNQILQLTNELKIAQNQNQTLDMLSNELVKSKQKLGDMYNRAMEIGGMSLYEKLMSF